MAKKVYKPSHGASWMRWYHNLDHDAKQEHNRRRYLRYKFNKSLRNKVVP